MFGPTSNPPSNPPTPTTEPANLGFYCQPQQIGGPDAGYNGYIQMGDTHARQPRPIMPTPSVNKGPMAQRFWEKPTPEMAPPIMCRAQNSRMVAPNSYNQPVGYQYWEQPKPMMAGPRNILVGQPYLAKPRPITAARMYNGPVPWRFWDQPRPLGAANPLPCAQIQQQDKLWQCNPQAARVFKQPNENAQAKTLPEAMNLKLVGFLNGQLVYEFPGPYSDAPPPDIFRTNEKRKDEDCEDNEQPYVKRPPNAFMLFMKEQRQKVVAEFNITNNAAVNVILGQRWKSLTQEEQVPYFERSEEERQLHKHQHPDWSYRGNFGIKRKRVRVANVAHVRAAEPEEDQRNPSKVSPQPIQDVKMQSEGCPPGCLPLSASVVNASSKVLAPLAPTRETELSTLSAPSMHTAVIPLTSLITDTSLTNTNTNTPTTPDTLTLSSASTTPTSLTTPTRITNSPAPQTPAQYVTIGEELLQMMVHVMWLPPAVLTQNQMIKSTLSFSEDDDRGDGDDDESSTDDESFTDDEELADRLMTMLENPE